MNSFLLVFKSIVKWTLLLILGLPLSIYLLLLLLNIIDEDKSTDVIDFEKFLSERTTLRDKNNAFVYAAGLSTKLTDDFYISGVDRIAKANKDSFSSELEETTSPAIDSQQDITLKTSDNLTMLLSGCGKPMVFDQACHQYLLSKRQQVDQLIVENEILLQRYTIMMGKPVWYESLLQPFKNGISIAPLSVGHKVIMLNAWREAARGNLDEVIVTLNQDTAFWRNAIVSTHTLINLMVMKSIVEESYQWGSFILKQFSAKDIGKNIPDEWQLPIITLPFSMKNIVIGEWLFTKGVFNQITSSKDWYSIFIKPLFNVQSSLNLYAGLSLETIKLEAFDERSVLVTKCQQGLTFSQLGWYSYNPVGKILTCIATPNFKNYKNDLEKLEETRQQTLVLLR